MIEAFIAVGALWLAVSLLLAASLHQRSPSRPNDNYPVWDWPLARTPVDR